MFTDSMCHTTSYPDIKTATWRVSSNPTPGRRSLSPRRRTLRPPCSLAHRPNNRHERIWSPASSMAESSYARLLHPLRSQPPRPLPQPSQSISPSLKLLQRRSRPQWLRRLSTANSWAQVLTRQRSRAHPRGSHSTSSYSPHSSQCMIRTYKLSRPSVKLT